MFKLVLLDMASAADEASAAGAVGAADLDHDAAGRSRTNQLMGVMTGGALHPVIGKQGFIDALASEAGSVPGGRNWRSIDRQYALWITYVIGHRIFQLTVCHGKGRVIREGNRVSGVKIGPDLCAGVNVIGGVGAQAADRSIDGNRAIMATQAGQGCAVRGGGHAGLQCRAAIHRKRTGSGLMVPQRDDLGRIRIVSRVTRRAGPVSRVPNVISPGEVVRRTFNTFIDGRP